MTKLTRLFSIAAVFAMAISQAQAFNLCDCNWYVSGSGSVAWHTDHEFNNATGCSTREYKTGYGFSGAVGIDFCPIRLELEGLFRKNSIDCFIVDDNTAGSSTFSDARGHTRDAAIMLNVFYDIPLCNCFSMYIGGGLGISFNDIELNFFNGTPVASPNSRSDELFAWQAMAGLSYPINDCMEIYSGYRAFWTEKVCTVSGIKSDKIPLTHGVDLGLRYYF